MGLAYAEAVLQCSALCGRDHHSTPPNSARFSPPPIHLLLSAFRPSVDSPELTSRAASVSPALLAPSNVRPEANSDGEGNRVCSPHGITTHKRAVLPSLPRY